VGTSVLVWALLFLLYWEGYLEEVGLLHVTGGMLFFFAFSMRYSDPGSTSGFAIPA